MTDLKIRFRTLDRASRATLGEVAGAIDGNTLDDFQAKIDEVLKSGVARVVLDFSRVRFVNSTGLGILVKASDSLRDLGGGVALIRVPEKIRLVIEMLGLDTYFNMRSNEEEALFSLGGSAEGHLRHDPRAATPTAVTTCGSCGLLISLPEPGSFRCPRCFAGVVCAEDGDTSFWIPDRPPPVILSFPCSVESCEGIVGFVQGFLKKLEYPTPRIREMEGALRDIGTILREKVHERGVPAVCHLKVEAEAMAVHLEISDAGKTLAQEEVVSYFKRVREVTDEFSCTPHPLGGNIIKFTKRK